MAQSSKSHEVGSCAHYIFYVYIYDSWKVNWLKSVGTKGKGLGVENIRFCNIPLHCRSINQLSVGWIAQLVEHCTGIAELMGLNPVQACSFQAVFLQTA